MSKIPRKYLLLGMGILGLLALFWLFSPLLSAIAYGILLAYLARPVAYSIRKVIGPGLASFLTLLVLVLGIFVLFTYTTTQIAYELGEISPDTIVSSLVLASNTATKFLSEHPEFDPLIASFSKQLDHYVEWFSSQVVNVIFQAINLIVTLVMALVIAFFLLYDGPKLRKFLEKALPKELVNQIDKVDQNLEGIYIGSLLSALIVGLITTLVFLVTGLPYPFLFGFVAAVLQFIQMVGPQLFLIPGVFVAAVFQDYFHAVVLAILAVFLFFVPDNVIKPVILKRTTEIHPLLVLLAFIGGVIVLGPAGFVLGPLILAMADGLIHAWLG